MSRSLTRRDLIKGSVAMAAFAFTQRPLSAFGFSDPEEGTELIPFLDKQTGKNGIQWEQLKSWITPNPEVYVVQHYNVPKIDPATWRLDVTGLVKKPCQLSLDDIKRRRRQTVIATIECSGNNNGPGFMGAVGNVRWTGTALAPILRDCRPLKRGIEVAFFGADERKEKIRESEYPVNFSRGLHLIDALRDDLLLCYEMNGEPLSIAHGAPLRLAVPGWFGVAWVKWLTRIEVLDRRIMSRYMARDYVTLRGEERDGKTVWRETGIGPILTKSIIARALRHRDGSIRLHGAAWTDGTPLRKVEVKIDDGPWETATVDTRQRSKYSWKFFTYVWKDPAPGEHTLVSRATDREGRVQPSAEDPLIKLKKTYWEANQQWPRRLQVS